MREQSLSMIYTANRGGIMKISEYLKANRYITFFIFGIVMGGFAKFVDFFPSNSIIGYIGVRDLMNYYGIWVVIATIIIYISHYRRQAIFRVICFLYGMVLFYYLIQAISFHYFPVNYCIMWLLIASFSSLFSMIVWLSKNENFALSIVGILIPILLLGNEAYKFIWTEQFSKFQLWFDVVCIFILFYILPQNKNLRIFTIILFLVLIPFISYFNIMRFITSIIMELF